jgi:hypothetical protein
MDIVKRCPIPQLTTPKRRQRTKGAISKIFTTDQKSLNNYFKEEFRVRNWEVNPLITEDSETELKADYKKERVQVEVQFGNMARWYTDIFKMQVSYAQDLIDIGVLIVPMQKFANTIDENVAHFERVCRELPYAKLSISVPILVIGINPILQQQNMKNKTLNGSD